LVRQRLADGGEHREAVHLRHVQVQEDDVRLVGEGEGERAGRLRAPQEVAETRSAEDLRQQVDVGGAVVDDEDARESRIHERAYGGGTWCSLHHAGLRRRVQRAGLLLWSRKGARPGERSARRGGVRHATGGARWTSAPPTAGPSSTA